MAEKRTHPLAISPSPPFANALWIAPPGNLPEVNATFFFRQRFTMADPVDATLRIAVAGNYAALVNGRLAAFGQYTDYSDHKTFTETPIGDFCRRGENELLIHYRYSGNGFSSHFDGEPGILAEIVDADGRVLAATDRTWEAAPDTRYESGPLARLSSSLDYVFHFDATALPAPWAPAMELPGRSRVAAPRPVPPPSLREFIAGRILREGLLQRASAAEALAEGPRFLADVLDAPAPSATGRYALFDLGEERAGVLEFEVEAPARCVVEIAHGEYLANARVPAWSDVGGRTFVDRVVLPGGRHRFQHLLRRFGCRYLELHVFGEPERIHILSAGLRVVELNGLETPPFSCSDPLFERFHEISARTLRLCLHDKYENCPWREQSICAYDAANQALFGYGYWGNYDRVAAMIRLFAQSVLPSGFLRAATPMRSDLCIPAFTFAWMSGIREYVLHSGDLSLFRQLRPQLEEMLGKILALRRGDLFVPPDGEHVWNYGEALHLEGTSDPPNAYYNLALHEALDAIGYLFALDGDVAKAKACFAEEVKIRCAADESFWDDSRGLYADCVRPDGVRDVFLGSTQALFLEAGVVSDERIPSLLRPLREGEIPLPTLAALPHLVRGVFHYGSPDDRAWMHATLRRLYGAMAGAGATTWWETELGTGYAKGMGSLCHGWSACPAWYESAYLLGITPLEPGYRRFRVRPYPGDLAAAEGQVVTPAGPVHIAWMRTGGGLEVRLAHPEGIEPVFERFPEAPYAKSVAAV